MLLTALVPSLSVRNVWDLPAWSWPQYRQLHDDYVKSMKDEG